MLTPFLWYLLLTLTGWITFPLAFRLLPGLADRGYALSRTLGLLLWGYLFWMLASLGLIYNTAGGVWLALLALAGVSAWLGWKRRPAWRPWLKAHRHMVLTTEIIFAIAFAFMTLVRAANPDIAGTEKPMELAFINAILHSPRFPPHDPWLSGYAISYYYFGYVLVAMLAKVSAAAAPVAFNLGLSSVFALAAAGAYGLAYSLLARGPRARPHPLPPLLAPIFLLLTGNAEALLEVLHARGWFWRAGGTSPFWAWLDIRDLTNPPQAAPSWSPERFWWWWRASRVLQDYTLSGSPREIIDEFPAFSFLLGDLHPHVLAMPFALLAAGLALNIFRGGGRGRIPRSRWTIWHLSPAAFTLAALTLGGMAFLNTWDFPIYVGLFAAAYTLRQARFAAWNRMRPVEFLTLGAALGAAGSLLYLPFYLGFASQAGGLIPNLVYVTRGAHLWVMFGTLFIPVGLWLLWRMKRERPPMRRGLLLAGGILLGGFLLALVGGVLAGSLPAAQTSYLGEIEALSLGAALRAAFLRRLSAPGGWLTLLALLIPVTALLSAPRRRQNLFPILLSLFGLLLILSPEFIYLHDQFGWRMNTIFKFYFQGWILLSLAAAYGSATLLRKADSLWAGAASLGLILSLGAGLLYPIFGFYTRTDRFHPAHGWNLDGGAYLERLYPDDMAAIHRLESAPPGVVAEAVGGSYTDFARVATYSGHPSVLGWPGHESQWRGGAEEMGSRENDLRRLYETGNWNEAQDILREYGVRYVFVGALERQTYNLNEDKFRRNLELVFEQGKTRVYRVP